MRLLLWAVAAVMLLFQLSSPPPVEAHLFGGPPFLSIDSQDAQTNPIYLSGASFAMPQDVVSRHYLVNQPISFKVDVTRLPVSVDIARQSTFKWTWDVGQSPSDQGTEVQHTYARPGSHLLSLSVKAPGEADFTELDTVRVNVLPHADYQLPQVRVSAVRDTFQTGRPLRLSSTITADPSTKIASVKWDFGDGATSTDRHPSHTYKEADFLRFVYVQVMDEQGLATESGITVTANGGTLALSPLIATSSSVPLIDASQAPGLARKDIPQRITLLATVAALGVVSGVWWWQRRSKRP